MSIKKKYVIPKTETFHYQLEKSFCDSYTSNSLQDYNLRSAGDSDLDIEWD